MADIDFAQIPFDLICRFGELTKNEIQVVCYLYGCRNTKTGQCNPSRRTISEDTKIHKSHLSPALKNLEAKGWISEDPRGNFILLGEPEKVTDSVTKVTDSVTSQPEKVTESVTKVTESVTESYGIGNSHIKELNIEGTEKEQRERRARAENEFLDTYAEYFPNHHVSLFQREIIANRIRDGTVWRKAVSFWAGNNYRPSSIPKICDKYDEIMAEQNGKSNGAALPTLAEKQKAEEEFNRNFKPRKVNL